MQNVVVLCLGTSHAADNSHLGTSLLAINCIVFERDKLSSSPQFLSGIIFIHRKDTLQEAVIGCGSLADIHQAFADTALPIQCYWGSLGDDRQVMMQSATKIELGHSYYRVEGLWLAFVSQLGEQDACPLGGIKPAILISSQEEMLFWLLGLPS